MGAVRIAVARNRSESAYQVCSEHQINRSLAAPAILLLSQLVCSFRWVSVL